MSDIEFGQGTVDWWKARAEAAEARCAELEKEKKELQETFDLRWEADMRAIKMWQAGTGKTMIWPDHADLCVWLLECLDALFDTARQETDE